MVTRSRLKAEEMFAEFRRQDEKTQKEKESAEQEIAAKIARLRALRLAKEASDEAAAKS